jgi:hypothetical protein
MDLDSFVHLRTHIWRLLREQQEGTAQISTLRAAAR